MLKLKTHFPKFIFICFLTTITLLAFFYFLFLSYFEGRIFPGVKIASYDMGGQTPHSISTTLKEESDKKIKTTLKINFEGQEFSISPETSKPQLDIDQGITAAYSFGRSGKPFQDLKDQISAAFLGKEIALSLNYKHPTLLIYQVNSLNQVIKKEPVNAKLILGEEIILSPSEDGFSIDSQAFLKEVENYLKLVSKEPTTIPLKMKEAKFTTEDGQASKTVLENLKNSPIKLHYVPLPNTKENRETIVLDQVAFLKILDLEGKQKIMPEVSVSKTEGVSFPAADIESKNIKGSQVVIDQDKLANYLKNLTDRVDQDVKEAKFVFNPDTKKVTEFQSAQEGKKIDMEKTALALSQAATLGTPKDIDLPVSIVKPKTTNTDANSFGIQELLGQGVSHFAGSIENRIYNINLATSRINGTLIAPGETFSFNKTVGEISASTGYKQAYVIKEGRTVLDDGGGVCQVSTTLFRAVLNAGLPITQRTAHAYRVSYYEQGSPPGLDATVFYPSVDFKFKNDTSAYILIQAYTSGTNLYFDIYGTPDNRSVSLTTPKVTSQTPPPPELRQDDSTLPRGTVKQVDWAAWGANVTFSRTVTKGGETIISETFKSNYRPWQAVYLVGTKD